MGQKYLIDSNAIIDFLDATLPVAGLQWLENIVDTNDYSLSVINRIEVLSTTAKTNTVAITEAFVAQSDIIPLEEAIVYHRTSPTGKNQIARCCNCGYRPRSQPNSRDSEHC